MKFIKTSAHLQLINLKEIYKGDPEWEKGLALFRCLSLRDPVTAEHSLEVAYYAALLANRLGLGANRYFLSGLLHDIGKIEMDDDPLKSHRLLSKQEIKDLKAHVLQGVLLLSELGFGKDIVQFCIRHHERLDGTGYPFSLGRENISLEGRIAMIVDVYSALTSVRTYRENKKIYTPEEAITYLKEEAIKDEKFDMKLLELFEDLILSNEDEITKYA